MIRIRIQYAVTDPATQLMRIYADLDPQPKENTNP